MAYIPRAAGHRSKQAAMIGRHFGSLEVLRAEPGWRGSHSMHYLCRCDCGTEVIRRGAELKRGQPSCGRYRCRQSTRIDPLTAAQQAAAEELLPKVLRIIRGQQRRWPHLADEIESVAQLALVEAVATYEPGKTLTLEKWCFAQVFNGIRQAVDAYIRHGTCELDREPAACGPSVPAVASDRLFCAEILAGISRLARETLVMHYMEGYSLAEVGRHGRERRARDVHVRRRVRDQALAEIRDAYGPVAV